MWIKKTKTCSCTLVLVKVTPQIQISLKEMQFWALCIHVYIIELTASVTELCGTDQDH